LTCDQNHDYTPEQQAYDHGLMDKFVEFTSGSSCTDKSIVMDYYDGNTVTALWNYAQFYAMSDNSYNTTFGPDAIPNFVSRVTRQKSLEVRSGLILTPSHFTRLRKIRYGIGKATDLFASRKRV
jgi:Phosphoesterase family